MTKDHRPEYAARGVCAEKAPPIHPVRPGKKGGKDAQDRDEAPDEDDCAAVAIEEVLPQLNPSIRDADVASIPQEEPVAEFATDPIPDVVAEDCTSRCGGDDPPNVEFVVAAAVEGGEYERRLAWQRKPHTFESDNDADSPVAVVSYEVLQVLER